MAHFVIADLALGQGRIGICPAPGRSGNYEADLSALLHWRPAMVLTMTTLAELDRLGASGLGEDLAAAGIGTIGVVDPDTVDVSNLQRQVLHDLDAVGVDHVELTGPGPLVVPGIADLTQQNVGGVGIDGQGQV